MTKTSAKTSAKTPAMQYVRKTSLILTVQGYGALRYDSHTKTIQAALSDTDPETDWMTLVLDDWILTGETDLASVELLHEIANLIKKTIEEEAAL